MKRSLFLLVLVLMSVVLFPSGAFAEEKNISITLITCEDEQLEGGYANRRIIAARPID
ncbi:MAG: hypothetical protein IJI41_09730 [Anaerolineaceae bacterium]|nr:hypothetical protein [Anaerolineaceae bacterium]